MMQACNGLLRIFNCAANGTADIIPVDLVVNLTIAAAWHTAIERYIVFFLLSL
jgi:hypothetical protein